MLLDLNGAAEHLDVVPRLNRLKALGAMIARIIMRDLTGVN
jgi:hypothetical protein